MGHVPGLSQWRLFWSYFCFSLMVSNAQLIYFTHKIHICFSPNASIMAINLSLMLTVATCVLSSRWRCLLLLNSGSRVTWRGQCWSSSPLWESAWNEGVGGVERGAERKGIRMKSSHGSSRDVLPIMRCSESERAVTMAQSNRPLPNSPFSLAVIGNAGI